MRVKLLTFALLTLLSSFGCGSSSDGASEGPEAGAEEGPSSDDAAGEGADGDGQDAPIDNASVAQKPLLKTCYKGDSFACAVEAVIVSETNAVRGSGRKALLQAFETSYVARDWSMKQASDGSISHDGFPYERKKVLLTDFPNAKWSFFAENVAMIAGRDTDAEAVGKKFVAMWKGSKGHLDNILGNHTYIGVGVARSGNSIYATQIFH